ncbi:MAG: hypothetical protein DRO88_11635 [Promethearchaeia archaeon]|nr:MAG: hypothetical protein DRO88_11635 [Candidatus Lokiarchaeia archaeon]
MNSHSTKDDIIYEEATFGASQFKDMIEWIKNRKGFELECKVTGEWSSSKDFFKGSGFILKDPSGNIRENTIYVILHEGDIGKEDILIGRRIIEINKSRKIKPFQYEVETQQKIFEIIEPNVFVLRNFFKKDLQNRIFFRNSEFDQALSWAKAFIKKYEISVYVEGIIIARDRQIPCIVTGTVKSTDENNLYINLWDAFNPHDPLNDDTKEWLTRNWTIQVSQTGVNKIHPKYILFEIGEELSLSRNVLTVEKLSVEINGRTIIENVNFNILKGEILGIIGESGAGKSTTLKAILGEMPYKGKIQVFGIDAHNTKDIAPFLGYVPQDLSRMYANFNCLENIVAFGRQFGVPDDILIQRGKKILKDLGIDHVANQIISSLSGGQKRRASIAIAMVHNPYLLFLDEPTSGLDPLARYELWDYLDIINKEYGITLVVISHYLDEIEYCDKTCIFLRGIGFFEFNTPEGLKKTLPGKGLALEVTLDKVNVKSVDILRNIEDVQFVIQRGERIRLLSNKPSEVIAKRVIKTLEEKNIKIHSLSYKVSIDMVDYFTYISVLHQEKIKTGSERLSKREMKEEMAKQGQNLEPAVAQGEDSKEKVHISVELDTNKKDNGGNTN